MASKSDNLNPETDGRMNKPLPVKLLQAIELQVVGGLDFQPALVAAGYSKSYANGNGHKLKHDVRYREELNKRLAENKTKSADDRMDTLLMLRLIRDDKDEATRDRTAAAKEIAAICGWHSETIKTELTDRQAVLDSAQRQEMSRLALLALDTRSLPDISTTRKTVQSTILAQTVPTEPVQDKTIKRWPFTDRGSDND